MHLIKKGKGINSCMIKYDHCYFIKLDIEALEAIPPGERTTLEQVVGHLDMSKTTVFPW